LTVGTDLVVGANILQRLDVGVAADQRHRLRRGSDDALDATAGAIPQQQQVSGTGIEDIDATGQERVGLRAAAAQIDPFGRDAGHAECRGVLFDQLLLFHDVRGHVENARLPRQRDLALLLRQRGRAASAIPSAATAPAPARHILSFISSSLRRSHCIDALGEMH
jgi:hypothetical protein